MIAAEVVLAGVYNARKTRAVSPNRKTVMFEIELTAADGGTSYIDSEQRPISENTVICAKPGQMRHTKLPFKCYFFHMIVNAGPLFNILTELPNFIDVQDGEIKELFLAIIEAYNAGDAENEILMQSHIFKLVYLLNRITAGERKRHSPKSNNREIIEKTVEYINNNLSSDLSLKRLAKEAKFSPVYFHKLFKASIGKSLHSYIEDRRIKKAAELLISTEMTLSEIAYECGFSSQSYFNYIFKRKKGLTPRDYAKSVMEGYNIG